MFILVLRIITNEIVQNIIGNSNELSEYYSISQKLQIFRIYLINIIVSKLFGS